MKRHAFDTANIILSCPLFYWIYYNLIWWLWLLSCVIHSWTLLKVSLRKKSADTYCSCQCRCHRVEEVKNSRICLPKTSKYGDSFKWFYVFIEYRHVSNTLYITSNRMDLYNQFNWYLYTKSMVFLKSSTMP